MKDFIILCKPVNFSHLDPKKISTDYMQMGLLIQQLPPTEQSRLKEFEIDENSVRFETIDNKLCVLFIAFRKPAKQ